MRLPPVSWFCGAVIAVVGVSSAAGCNGTGFACECFACAAAISLDVRDDDGNPVGGDWSVEARLDENPVDTSACDPQVRNGSNTCGFGFEAGVYEIVVRSPREEKELRARFAGRAGQDCCSCLTGETVPVILEQQ